VVKDVPHHLTAVVVICSAVLTLNFVWTEQLKVLGVLVVEHVVLKEVTQTNKLINLELVHLLVQEDLTVEKNAQHPLNAVVPACSVVLNGRYVWIRQLKAPMVTVVVLVTLLRMFKLRPWRHQVPLIWLRQF
jgi:alpha-N-acetylglucosamine transferase